MFHQKKIKYFSQVPVVHTCNGSKLAQGNSSGAPFSKKKKNKPNTHTHPHTHPRLVEWSPFLKKTKQKTKHTHTHTHTRLVECLKV
jgi:hypothetical protein